MYEEHPLEDFASVLFSILVRSCKGEEMIRIILLLEPEKNGGCLKDVEVWTLVWVNNGWDSTIWIDLTEFERENECE